MQEYQVSFPWLDFRLPKKAMEHLWDSINDNSASHENANETLAGNISKSEYIKDKDDWFYETVLKELSEYMFFKKSWENYYDVHITKYKPTPKFHLKSFWVNYQKQYEFNPPHNHAGEFSFVVFMKIPTHWKEQHALPFSANSNMNVASDFAFILGEDQEKERVGGVLNIPLSPEDEGRMLFFPAWMFHEVYPFYGTEKERVTISGNIMAHEKEE